MHKKNIHKTPYDLAALTRSSPHLKKFIILTKLDKPSINFFDPQAVLALNQALLKHHYQINHWDLPNNYLCPPIPGRVDYIHTAADLLTRDRKTPKGRQVKCLDIGVGANCIYPILGHKIYGWEFIASDVNGKALAHADSLLKANNLAGPIKLRQQQDRIAIFKDIIRPKEMYALGFCNPPFHASEEEALKSAQRKERNLKGAKSKSGTLNFGGQASELWCKGGEKGFIRQMIEESKTYKFNCLWFTSLVSKEKNLPSLQKLLTVAGVDAFKIIPMLQGNKKSRLIAWSYFTASQRNKYLALLNI